MSSITTSPSFLASLRQAIFKTLQWRLLLLSLALLWLPTLLLALPLWRILASQLDHAVQAPDWARRFDLLLWSELARLFEASGALLGGSGLFALAGTVALMPFLHAMGMAAARETRRLNLGELLHGGLRHYGPMLRLLLWSLIPLAAIAGVAAAALHAVDGYGEHAVLESDVNHLRWAVLAIAALLTLIWHACMEAGRGWLAFAIRGRSALGALVQGVRLVLARPWRSLGLYLSITLKAAVLLAVLGLLRAHLPGLTMPAFIGGLLLTQLLSLVNVLASFAKLFAMRDLTAEQHASSLSA